MPFFGGGSDPGAARKQLGIDNNYAGDFSGRGTSSWDTLFPALQSDITNPQGFSPTEKAAMNTAAEQSLGGSMAGAVGQGALMAGRTRNPGSMGAALDASAHGAQRAQSQAALGVEEASANLAQEKQQAALKELGSLYGMNVSGLNDMLGQANTSLGTYEKAKSSEGSILGDLAQIGNIGKEFAGFNIPSFGGGGGGGGAATPFDPTSDTGY